MSKPRIAFLGLGTMGNGMANCLADAGFPLTVYNRNRDKGKALTAKGARVADSPRDAAKDADIIIAMLSDDSASRGVWLGESGALAGAKAGAIAIDSSTITVDWVREFAVAAQSRGIKVLDAPVTGTKPNAEKGELVFLVGGDAATLESARPALAVMSKEIVHLGPVGSGAAMKLINNFVCGVQAAALGEALAMIKKSGLNPETAVPVMTTGAPGSPLFKGFYTRYSTNDPTIYFHLELMAKDLTYAIKEAQSRGLDLVTAKAALERYKQAISAGMGKADVSGVLRYVANS